MIMKNKLTKKLRLVKKDLQPLNNSQMSYFLGGNGGDQCTYNGCTDDCTHGGCPPPETEECESKACPTQGESICFNTCGCM